MLGQVGTVVSIWRYPVKGMAAESLFAAPVTEQGIVGDRIYAVVDRDQGTILDHKSLPTGETGIGLLSQIQVTFAGTPTAERIPPVRFAFGKGAGTTSNDGLVHRLLSDWLGRTVELVRVRGSVAGPYFTGDPICIVTTASLERLRVLHPSELAEPQEQRPSLLIRTTGRSQAFAEEEWIGKVLLIGGKVRVHVTRARRDPNRRRSRDVGVQAVVLEEGTVSSGDMVMLT